MAATGNQRVDTARRPRFVRAGGKKEGLTTSSLTPQRALSRRLGIEKTGGVVGGLGGGEVQGALFGRRGNRPRRVACQLSCGWYCRIERAWSHFADALVRSARSLGSTARGHRARRRRDRRRLAAALSQVSTADSRKHRYRPCLSMWDPTGTRLGRNLPGLHTEALGNLVSCQQPTVHGLKLGVGPTRRRVGHPIVLMCFGRPHRTISRRSTLVAREASPRSQSTSACWWATRSGNVRKFVISG